MQYISIILYIFAPKTYSWEYNVALLIIFIINFYSLTRHSGYKLSSYSTLFFIIFFFINFVYPVFIFPYDPTFILQFRYSFSPDYINKGTALCLCAFSMYIAGYTSKIRPVKSFQFSIRTNKYQLFTIISYLVLLYNLYNILPQIGVNYGDADVPFQSGSLFVTMECTLATIVCHINKEHIKGNLYNFISVLKPHILASGIFCFAILLLGSREYVLVLTLLYVFLFTKYVKPLSFTKFCIGIIIGIIGLYYISQVRNHTTSTQDAGWEHKSWQSQQVSGIWNLATDLIINNRNVYVGMQYTEDPNHGYSWGINYIPNLLSPIPFLPSIFTSIFLGKPPVECTSQQILTNYTRDDLGHRDLDYELGSNCVIDVYMGFGIVGVILLFFMLGKLIRTLETADNNVPLLCIYLILFTTVIFFCRSSFFGPVRNIVWSYLMSLLILRRHKI